MQSWSSKGGCRAELVSLTRPPHKTLWSLLPTAPGLPRVSTYHNKPANEAWVPAHQVPDLVLLPLQLPDIKLVSVCGLGCHGALHCAVAQSSVLCMQCFTNALNTLMKLS